METYFKLKMIEEYIIPIILIVLGVVTIIIFFILSEIEYKRKMHLLRKMEYEKREEQFDHNLDIKSYYYTKTNKNDKLIKISENRINNMSYNEFVNYLERMEGSE